MDQEAGHHGKSAGRRRDGLRLGFAWLGFAALALALLLPPRFSATARLGFDLATPPSPTMVSGVIQMLHSRELAAEALADLPQEDVAHLAQSVGPQWIARLMGRSPDGSDRERAATALSSSLRVEPARGGRALELTVSADQPARAGRAARAYIAAFSRLDAGARKATEHSATETAPALRLERAPQISNRPDLPSPAKLTVILLMGAVLVLITLRLRRRPLQTGRVALRNLPRESMPAVPPTWFDGTTTGSLGTSEAADLLARRLTLPDTTTRLVVVTSEQPMDRSAPVAVALARRLAEGESRVALVALDGDSGDLAGLVSDPWAPGMAEMLFGVAGFGETIHRDTRSRAHVIPPGRHARGGAGIVHAERLSLILSALSQTYDFVIVAAPAFAGTSGAVRLAKLDPLLVCIEEENAHGGGIDTFEALSARGFRNVVMLRLSAQALDVPTPECTDRPLPTPSLTAHAA